MEVEQVAVEALIPYANNARRHDDLQVAQLAGSIREFGWTQPVLIDQDNGIIAGHGRVLAARKLGMELVPCIRLSHLTDKQRRAYILADNKLALNATWDLDLLRLEVGRLDDEGVRLDLAGFTGDELRDLRLVDEDTPPAAGDGTGGGIDYEEKFSVVVICSDEAHQEAVYERLTGEGFTCKVLVN